MISTFFEGTRISFEKREDMASGLARCHSCRKSVHGGNLTWRGPSSRLHQWHSSVWLSFLSGISHSPNQSKQATLYLMIIPASVPHLSCLCAASKQKKKKKTTHWSQVNVIQPSSSILAFIEQFYLNLLKFGKIGKCLSAIRCYCVTVIFYIVCEEVVCKRWGYSCNV